MQRLVLKQATVKAALLELGAVTPQNRLLGIPTRAVRECQYVGLSAGVGSDACDHTFRILPRPHTGFPITVGCSQPSAEARAEAPLRTSIIDFEDPQVVLITFLSKNCQDHKPNYILFRNQCIFCKKRKGGRHERSTSR